MKYALWILGILTAVVMACPQLVAIGYFFLIVPGLILTIVPTVFVYLAGTAAISRFMPCNSKTAANAAGFASMLVLGWVVMQPFRVAALNDYEASLEPDVTPNAPIQLHGRVLIESPDAFEEPRCDHVCLAVLDSPQVDSVTVATGGRKEKRPRKSVAYQLQPAEIDPSPGLFPYEPGRIVYEHRPQVKAVQSRQRKEMGKAIEAGWALRLADNERLRLTNPVASSEADWIVRIDDLNQNAKTKLHRITISDATGTVRFRKTYRSQPIPSSMFHFGFEAFSGGGPISGASFHIGREIRTSGSISLHPESELLVATGFQVRQPDLQNFKRLRRETVAVLNDAKSSAARLELARRFLGMFFFDAKEPDYKLIANVIADERVRNIDEQLMNVFSTKNTPVAMRDAYAERITMNHTSPKLRRWLAEGLTALPAGTFKAPSPTHLDIWRNPERYKDAGPFFERTADLGATKALPLLRTAVKEAVEIRTWKERRSLIAGVREALVELGPSASEAVPELCELFLRRPSPLMNNSGDADDWRFALARMGMDVNELPFFPTQSPDTARRISGKIAKRLQRYEQEFLAKANR
ncbi:MAG: hypothetical protein NXI04_03295 [Planctomycetaceae bacterium]|nr:hypothetical protein [Planctomycetaceae bacterium]